MELLSSDAEENFKPIYKCKWCKLSFETKRDSLLHKKKIHEVRTDEFTCKTCGKRFAKSMYLNRHVKLHDNIRPFVCHICGKAFAQATNLQRHHYVHNGKRPFTCTVCNKSFKQQGVLSRHELTHTGEKPFHCKRCSMSFSQRVHLKKHVMLHQDYRPYSCDVCDKTFIQAINHKIHMQRHKDRGEISVQVEQRIFECDLCGAKFNRLTDLEEHPICNVIGEEVILANAVSYGNCDANENSSNIASL